MEYKLVKPIGLFTSSRILLIIAHPDDEVMFFSPLLISKRDSAGDVYILCLSTGNYKGLGDTRCKELYKSCAIFGIPRVNIKIINHEFLQDSMDEIWPPDYIVDIVKHYVIEFRPDKVYLNKTSQSFMFFCFFLNLLSQIITFDNYGVSGHPNHIAGKFFPNAYYLKIIQ